MIIVKLMGGLGNQMFQYAAGRCLAHLHKTELKLDLSYLNKDPQNKYTKREYKLDVFNLKAEFANENDIKPFLPLDRGKISNTLMRKLPILYSKVVANESGHKFMKEFYSFPKHVYLNGFWQSEHYFEPVEDVIRQEFTIKESLSKENSELCNKIVSYNSVSLHIRRGDYITNTESNSYHGVCSLEYYEEAISYLKKTFNDPAIFVFSDDIEWAKVNLKTDVNVNFVEQNNPGHIDMHLMALCKHNIIANSSFSWWAAWLNKNADKTVIAPIRWFADIHNTTPDIYPQNWIRL
jgi:hypothetical protein